MNDHWYFMPAVGDIVEFLSDQQTEKGPSSGSILSVDYRNDRCVIEHSDTKETFAISKLQVRKFTRHRNHPDRKPYWGMA
jgi:hypothetical protein